MTKKLFTVLYVDEYLLYFNEDSGHVVFSYNEMGAELILVLIILILMIILMKRILILLFLPDFGLDILNLKDTKNLKKNKIKN